MGYKPHIGYHGNRGGSVYSSATSLLGTGQETYLYVNRNAVLPGQYINIDTHGEMLSTTLISVPVSKQVNKDVSIRHPFPACCAAGRKSLGPPLVVTFLLKLESP